MSTSQARWPSTRLALYLLVDDVESFVHDTMVLPCVDADTETRVDFVFSFSPYAQQALTRVRPVTLDGETVHFASPEDLVIHKLVAGRPRDLEDVKGILAKTPELDREYLDRWLRAFADALGKPLKSQFDDLSTQA